MTTSEEKQLGRAKNAVLTFLENRLIVPKIYLDADWGGQKVDVLAIERDGVGDVYAVLLFARKYFSDGRLDLDHQNQEVSRLLDQFSAIAANYKYIAAVDPDYIKTSDGGEWIAKFPLPNWLLDKLFSPDYIGRVGLLHVSEREPQIFSVLQSREQPERFRAKIAKLADEYVQQHEADWEIRA